MSVGLRILLVLFSAMTMLYMIKKIRNSKLQIEYSIFWIIFSILLLLMSLFPNAVIFLAHLLGIQSAVNFVFLSIIFILMLKIFMMTIELSQLENKVKELTQKISIDASLKSTSKRKSKEEDN